MQSTTPTQPAHHHPAPGLVDRTRPTMVAVEAVLLWPRGVGESVTTIDEAGLWPVFAVVLDEREAPVAPGARQLFDLLDRPEHADRIAVVDGRCQWTVLDARHAVLKLAVRASAPFHVDLDIVLPARPVLGILDVVARGATVAITTRRHSSRLTGQVDIREALNELVLLSCTPSAELATLARTLRQAQADGQLRY